MSFQSMEVRIDLVDLALRTVPSHMQRWQNMRPFDAVCREVMWTSYIASMPHAKDSTVQLASNFRCSPFLYSYPLSSRQSVYPDGSNVFAVYRMHSSQRCSLNIRRRRRKKGGMPERYELNQDLQGNWSLSSMLPLLKSLRSLPDT